MTGVGRFKSSGFESLKEFGIRHDPAPTSEGSPRHGYFVAGRRTERKRSDRSFKSSMSDSARRGCGVALRCCVIFVSMQGHIHYYGVSGNHRQLAAYVYFASVPRGWSDVPVTRIPTTTHQTPECHFVSSGLHAKDSWHAPEP